MRYAAFLEINRNSAIMADWNIRPRATQCTGCGNPFEPRATGHTLLIQTEGGYQRSDLCTACFKKRSAAEDAFLSAVWPFTVPAENTKTTKKEAPVQKETAIRLLRRLIAREHPDDIDAMYILAILLERNKQLIERDVRQQADGKTFRVYEFKPTGEIFRIESPDLRTDNLEAVQRRVIDLLEGRESLVEATATPSLRPMKRIQHHHRQGKSPVKRHWRIR